MIITDMSPSRPAVYNAAPVTINFVIKHDEYTKQDFSNPYFDVKYSKIIKEGSALVQSRRDEPSTPLRDILGETGAV